MDSNGRESPPALAAKRPGRQRRRRSTAYIKIKPPYELYPSCQIAEMQEWLTEQGSLGLILKAVRGKYCYFQQSRPADMVYRIEPVLMKKAGNASRIEAWRDAGFSVVRTWPFNTFYALDSKKINDLHSSRQSFARLYKNLAATPGATAMLFAFAFCLFLVAAVFSLFQKSASASFQGGVLLTLGIEQIVFFFFWRKVRRRLKNISDLLEQGMDIGPQQEISKTPLVIITTVLLAVVVVLLIVSLNS
jgi:hypothetical protein